MNFIIDPISNNKFNIFSNKGQKLSMRWRSHCRRWFSECSEPLRDQIRRANAVCFDVDSTVITTEGIDELGAFLGKAEEVAELTKKAMGGDMPFQDALSKRLQLLKPSRVQIERLLEEHPPELTPGMQDLVDTLRAGGKSIFLVSGGFENMIQPVADQLGIPAEHVFANRILFNNDDEGTYRGFDTEAFTSRAGGKARAIWHLKDKYGFSDGVVMVGDGRTDYEARQEGAADLMIGYGGVIVREVVEDNADVFIRDWSEFQTLAADVNVATNDDSGGGGGPSTSN